MKKVYGKEVECKEVVLIREEGMYVNSRGDIRSILKSIEEIKSIILKDMEEGETSINSISIDIGNGCRYVRTMKNVSSKKQARIYKELESVVTNIIEDNSIEDFIESEDVLGMERIICLYTEENCLEEMTMPRHSYYVETGNKSLYNKVLRRLYGIDNVYTMMYNQILKKYGRSLEREVDDWEVAEKLVYNHYLDSGELAIMSKRNQVGYDMLLTIDGELSRVDVKYASGKVRNSNELQFNINKKYKEDKKTDYYMLVYRDNKDSLRIHKLKYEDVKYVDHLTVSREKENRFEKIGGERVL